MSWISVSGKADIHVYLDISKTLTVTTGSEDFGYSNGAFAPVDAAMSRLQPRPFDARHLNIRFGMGIALAIAILFLLWLFLLLLPWLLLLTGALAGLYGWRRHRQFQQRLYTCFYTYLKTHDGRMSVLDFAMVAGIAFPKTGAATHATPLNIRLSK